jgi:hypothetical protein
VGSPIKQKMLILKKQGTPDIYFQAIVAGILCVPVCAILTEHILSAQSENTDRKNSDTFFFE